MLTKENLFRQLKELGVGKDRPVTVHTSLKAIGEVEGNAEGLLRYLIEYVTEDGGLLLVPAHTWHRFFGRQTPTLDIPSDDICIGTFPKIAVRSGLGYRSAHPTHSVVAFGEKERALAFIAQDEKAVTMSAPVGCMGELERQNGDVLLIGVGQERNTYLHTCEEDLGVKNRVSGETVTVTVRYPDGRMVKRPFRSLRAEGIGDVSEHYPKFEPAFERYGAVRKGKIGNAEALLCSARKMKEVLGIIVSRKGDAELLSDDRPLDEGLYLPED